MKVERAKKAITEVTPRGAGTTLVRPKDDLVRPKPMALECARCAEPSEQPGTRRGPR